MKLNIAIIGGGIAGLTAALELARNGHSIAVFEQANTFEDIGAGIQLSPNANEVLNRLGLGDAVKAISFQPDILQLINGKTGATLSTLPLKKQMQKRYSAPYLVAHRGDLQSVLLESSKAASNIVIHTGAFIDRFKKDTDRIEIAGEKFNLLIAANGIDSALRGQIDPDAIVVANGQTAWRATLPLSSDTQNAVSVYMNSGAHMVAYKMGARPVLNLVYVSSNTSPPSADNFSGKARELINDASNWKAWPLASVQSNVWHKGCAVLIGDAAHAMTPHAAQGGAMAIEDAMVLADCIATYSDIAAALEAYRSKRQPRIARVSALSAQNRAIYQMGGVIAFGRNLAMPLIPPSMLLRRLDWLYAWTAQ